MTPSNLEEIQSQLLTYIESLPRTHSASLQINTTLITSGLIDSLSVIDLVSYAESHFGLKFDNAELIPENFDSVSALATLIVKKREKR